MSTAPQAPPAPPPLPFARHHAFVIGIDAYGKVSPLATAVRDATRLAQVLAEQQHFEVHPPLLDADRAALQRLLHETLPQQVAADDRVLFYFAGHGVAGDGDDGPAGYLVPADGDPTDPASFVPMAELQQALQALPCRHLLLILDCCFSGAFRWASTARALGTLMPKRIYKERFDRFVTDPAWQVITSAAYDQKALDVLQGKATGDRGQATAEDGSAHSPFALALFDGLAGAADAVVDREGDGVITATELYAYIRDRVEPASLRANERQRQTPGLFPLARHDKGEFVFLHPRHRLNLPPIPGRSPYKGLASFDEEDRLLFYGRDRAIAELQALAAQVRLVVVSGASGTGKSSVIKAGLLPLLRAQGHRILPVMRPGTHPLQELERALAAAGLNESVPPPGTPGAVLVIDQFEEVIARCADAGERDALLLRLRRLLDAEPALHRLILTVRADFEPQLSAGALQDDWRRGRCTVPPFSLQELKEVIVLPTLQEVLIFDPPELVERIVAEVVQSPGALPLLSYALSELYEAYASGGRQDRALRGDDYERLGGVMGALRTKADALHAALPAAEQQTLRRIMLRMVSVEGDLAGRRVAMDELVFEDAERARVAAVLERLVEARLIVQGPDFVEPAHDALVRAWKTLHDWIHEVGRDRLTLGARLNAAAAEYVQTGDAEFLWNANPNLPVLERELRSGEPWLNAKERAFVVKSVARRKRRLRLAVGTVAAVLVVVSSLALWAWQQKGVADEQRVVAVQEKEGAQRGQSLLLADLARQQNRANNHVHAALLALEALPQSMAAPDRPYVAAPELELHAALGALAEHVALQGHAGRVTFTTFSPDDRLIVSASHDGTARLWDGASGRLLQVLKGHRMRVAHAAFDRSGKRLVTASEDGTARLWDTATGEPILSFGSPRSDGVAESIYHASFSPDGSRVALASSVEGFTLWETDSGRRVDQAREPEGMVAHAVFSPDGTLVASSDRFAGTTTLWDGRSGALLGTLSGHSAGLYSLAFSADSARLVTASADGTARVWDLATRRTLQVLSGHRDKVFHADFSPDGRQVVTASKDGSARLWRLGRQQAPLQLEGHGGEVRHAVFSADGQVVATVARDRVAKLWSSRDGHLIGTLAGHVGDVTHAAFSRDGQRLLTSGDTSVRLWNLGAPRANVVLPGGREPVASATFSPDGSLVATGSGILTSAGEISVDPVLRLWNASSGALLAELRRHTEQVGHLAFSPDGRRLVSLSRDNSIRVWDVSDPARARELLKIDAGHTNEIALSPDAELLASGGADGHVLLWQLASGRKLATLKGHTEPIMRLSFSADGRMLASASMGPTARIWDVAGRQLMSELKGHRDWVRSIAFSPDGSRVATAAGNKEYFRESSDNSVRLCNPATGQQEGQFDGHAEQVNHVVFSPDGRFLASSSGYDAGTGVHGTRSRDNSVIVWDLARGQPRWRFDAHAGPVTGAAFSPAGDRLVTASRDSTATVWRLDTGEAIALLPHRDSVNSASFDSGGQRVLTAAGDQYSDKRANSAHIWRLQPDTQTLIDQARLRLGKATLSAEERKRYFLAPLATAPTAGPAASAAR